MGLVVPNAGAIRLLARTLSSFTPGPNDLALRLFKNDYTPDAASVLADFQEATFGGYFRQWIDSAGWPTPTIVGGKASSTYSLDPFTWTVTDPGQTVYGYYVEEAATATVLWAERLATPRVLFPGGQLELTLILTGKSAA